VPKGCSEGFCHFWHLVNLEFSRNTPTFIPLCGEYVGDLIGISGVETRLARYAASASGSAGAMLTCSGEELRQDIRPVGHDAVHSVAEQPTHVGLAVYGPDIYPDPQLVGSPNEAWRYHVQHAVDDFGAL
jgi:hypothetical protein